MSRARLDPVALLPRGLSADEAARYVGVGRTKFEELVFAAALALMSISLAFFAGRGSVMP